MLTPKELRARREARQRFQHALKIRQMELEHEKNLILAIQADLNLPRMVFGGAAAQQGIQGNSNIYPCPPINQGKYFAS